MTCFVAGGGCRTGAGAGLLSKASSCTQERNASHITYGLNMTEPIIIQRLLVPAMTLSMARIISVHISLAKPKWNRM